MPAQDRARTTAPRCRPLATVHRMAGERKLSKHQRRKQNEAKEWKQEVDTAPEPDILREWAESLTKKGWRIGRWRRTIQGRRGVQLEKEFQQDEKKPGTLLLVGKKWNLYFFKDSIK